MSTGKVASVTKIVIGTISAVRLLPHLAVLILSPRRELLWRDLDRFGELRRGAKPLTLLERVILFIEMMTFFPEYRNVFYFRHKTIRHLLGLLCRPMKSLGINVGKCSPGLFIQDGVGTLISAEEIGANCWIGPLVTIGYVNNAVDRPRIGNNVTICPGARVLGAVTVGDGAYINANSLVISDVPPGASVIGVPARLVPTKAGQVS